MSNIRRVEQNNLSKHQSTNDCYVCSLLAHAKDSILLVSALEHGTVFLHQNQSYKGRCIYTFHQHYVNIVDVSSELFKCASVELQHACKAISDVFRPDLLNIAMLGNHERHLHWHIIPRYRNDSNWGNPPWPSEQRVLSDGEYISLAASIREKLGGAIV